MKRSACCLISFVLIFCFALLFTGTSDAQQRRTIVKSFIGCTNKNYYNKLVNFAVEHDNVAFKKACLVCLLAGQCTLFKVGEQVYVVDTSIFSGLVKLRRPGDLAEYWTAIESIQ